MTQVEFCADKIKLSSIKIKNHYATFLGIYNGNFI